MQHDNVCQPLVCRGNKTVLRDNLAVYGWSPIVLNVNDELEWTKEERTALSEHQHWKAQLAALFAPSAVEAASSDPTLVFRSAESGDPLTIESKQSWELTRRAAAAQPTSESLVRHRLRVWQSILHRVAQHVVQLLEWPENILMQAEGEQSLDLLRVFYYDTGVGYGSSPHTDWGSWTVVHQDQVGGLQTHCRKCQQWHNVPSSPVVASHVEFIVHVGDMTSLALNAKNQGSTVAFPSPLHRVVSPIQEKRGSLVYFVYPPPHATLAQLSQQLAPYAATGGSRLEYADYYLLKNQQTGDGDEQQEYQRLLHQPLAQVLAKKWAQVQR